MRLAPHTRIKLGREAESEAAHREVPAEGLPVNIAWQARMAEPLEVVHDYSGEGVSRGLPVVWRL